MSIPAVRQVIRIDIFISSPGDLGEERAIVRQVIEKLNRSSLKNNYFLVPFLFEDEVPPEIGEDAQLIVDRYMQVQNSYILVSMFWTRMGTPFTIIDTNERYESGTQYELLKGYEHFQKTNHPHILLYRKQKENPKADPTQKQKVETFFKSFIGDPPTLKGLFAKYTEPAELGDKLEEHILKIIDTYPPLPETSQWIEPPEFKEEPRRIDAAMPGETAVEISTPVQVMICLPDSEGLEAFLPKRAGKDEIKKKDVRAGGLTIAFPVDKKTGKVKAARITIALEAADFKMDENSADVRLAVGLDSGQITFNVVPVRPSRKSLVTVRVKSKALDGSELECGSVVLSTKIKAAKDQAPLQSMWNLVSRSLGAASAPEDQVEAAPKVRRGKKSSKPPSRPKPPKSSGSKGPSGPGAGRPGPKISGGRFIYAEGIGPDLAFFVEKLEWAGVDSTHNLLLLGGTAAGRKELARKTGISEKMILDWVNRADLFRIKGVGEQYADLLEEAGVDTMVELAQRKADNLFAKMVEVNASKNLVNKMPALSQVEKWIAQAKKLPRKVSY